MQFKVRALPDTEPGSGYLVQGVRECRLVSHKINRMVNSFSTPQGSLIEAAYSVLITADLLEDIL